MFLPNANFIVFISIIIFYCWCKWCVDFIHL